METQAMPDPPNYPSNSKTPVASGTRKDEVNEMPDATHYDDWKTVDSIAQDCKEQYPDQDYYGTQGYIIKSVGASAWIIYNYLHEIVLQASENEPEDDEVRSLSAPLMQAGGACAQWQLL